MYLRPNCKYRWQFCKLWIWFKAIRKCEGTLIELHAHFPLNTNISNNKIIVSLTLWFFLNSNSFYWRIVDLQFLKKLFIYLNCRLIALQYCGGFAIHWHESVMGVHVSPRPEAPTSLWYQLFFLTHQGTGGREDTKDSNVTVDGSRWVAHADRRWCRARVWEWGCGGRRNRRKLRQGTPKFYSDGQVQSSFI